MGFLDVLEAATRAWSCVESQARVSRLLRVASQLGPSHQEACGDAPTGAPGRRGGA